MDNVRAKHTVASKHKFAKAIENMALNYDIGPYYGTGDDKKNATIEFVDKLRQYYKINKTCSVYNLADCWGYRNVKFPNRSAYDISDAVNGKLFKNGGNESLSDDYDVDTVGILGTDGTRFILAYNKNCEVIEPQTYVWTKDGTNNSSTGCVAAILDIDGNKAPNTIGKDVSFLNATSIGKNCVVELGDACFGSLFLPTAVSYDECMANKSKWGLKSCFGEKRTEQREQGDLYAGVAKACGGAYYMLTINQFEKWAQEAYGSDKKGYKTGSASEVGLFEPPSSGHIFIWVYGENNLEVNEMAHYVRYSNTEYATDASGSRSGTNSSAAQFYGLCRIIQ